MAAFGGLGKALGLGSTGDVVEFGINAAANYYSGGVIPIQSTPFKKEEPQQMFQQDPGLTAEMNRMRQGYDQGSSLNNFFGNVGSSLGSFGRDVGGFFENIAPLTSLFGVGQQGSQGVQGPARTIQMRPPEETSSSGEYLGANLGLAGGLVAGGRALARSSFGKGLIGGAAGSALSLLGDSCERAPRITRKMKADVRRIYMMAGMDPNGTAQILNSLGTYPRMNFDANLVFFILTKRFRNDGPVVTKAAVRKTRSTLRRMKGVVDMYNSVCKAPTRRAPMRRATKSAVQLIKN